MPKMQVSNCQSLSRGTNPCCRMRIACSFFPPSSPMDVQLQQGNQWSIFCVSVCAHSCIAFSLNIIPFLPTQLTTSFPSGSPSAGMDEIIPKTVVMKSEALGDYDDQKKNGFLLGGDEQRKKVSVKKGFAGGGSSGLRCCQAENCTADLSDAKPYHKRHKVCEYHAKAQEVIVCGIRQRFCQQCSRFHELGEFDETKRSCRSRLAGHNERRRKGSVSDQSEEEGSSQKRTGTHQVKDRVCGGGGDDRASRIQITI